VATRAFFVRFLFGHDLRANAFRVCREGKPLHTFSDHALRHEVPVFRVLVEIVDDEAAAGNHLVPVGADQLQRALDEFGGDAAPAQAARCLGVGDDDGLRRFPIDCERDLALDVELEAALQLVVANRGHRSNPFFRSYVGP
jgi:hypothetical protein